MGWLQDRWGQGGIFGKTGLAGAVNWDRNRNFYGNAAKNIAVPVALAADYFTGGALTPLEAGLLAGGVSAAGEGAIKGSNFGDILRTGASNGALATGADSLASAFAPGSFAPSAGGAGGGLTAGISPTDPSAALKLGTSGLPSMADAPGASSALMDQAMASSPTNPLAAAFAPSSGAPAVAPGLADADAANDEFAAANGGPAADQPGSLTPGNSAGNSTFGPTGAPNISKTGIGSLTGAPSTPINPGAGPSFATPTPPKSIGDSILSGVKNVGSWAAKNPNTLGMGLQAIGSAPLNEAQADYMKYQLARLKQQNTALDPLRAAIFGAYAKNATTRPTPFTAPTPYTLPPR